MGRKLKRMFQCLGQLRERACDIAEQHKQHTAQYEAKVREFTDRKGMCGAIARKRPVVVTALCVVSM